MQLAVKEQRRLKENYGPWALVTGASSGIGMELAAQLASAGLNLVVNGRNTAALQRVKAELQLKYSVDVKIVAADVSTTEGIRLVIDATANVEIGLLVASAGYGTSGDFINADIAAEVNMLRVNCEALLILTHHFGRLFASKQKGGIILMSSMVGFQGVPHAAHYAATKAYVQSLAEGLYYELKPYRVAVLAASPGPVESGFSERADMRMSMSLKPQQVAVPILMALGRKLTVLPGMLTKLLVYSLRMLPRTGKIKVMEKVMGGMTQHQKG